MVVFVAITSIPSENKKIPKRSGSHHREMLPTNIDIQISNAKCRQTKADWKFPQRNTIKPQRNAIFLSGMRSSPVNSVPHWFFCIPRLVISIYRGVMFSSYANALNRR
ncbi:MAG: hypothetical protein ACK5HT_08625 [Draconibacterium sp.]